MMALAALLGLLGSGCCLAAHRTRPPRRWVPHLVMAAAMVAMALPGAADPLGPALWCPVLAAATGWTALTEAEPPRVRLPVALDLLAMAALSFLHWRGAAGGGTTAAVAHAHSGAGAGRGVTAVSRYGGGPGLTLTALVLIALWAAARMALLRRVRIRRGRAGLGALATAGALGLMLP
ncbi:hypothetical protein [Streptomyces cucumeris]|uniref:hypothetical protein n=1 Tax=Streptomyces cucumeris TaxID=2962890 RepID=UPI0020C8701D|nr:hypothetical protein [Streptomyces sp. NEAU-Y11]MCP9207860.1 hypothetical protein [Streptomyces sp. NEAU-Y11]